MTTTIDELAQSVAVAKARAQELAAAVIERGGKPDAPEGHRILAEVATIELELGEKRANLIDAKVAQKWIDDFLEEATEMQVAAMKAAPGRKQDEAVRRVLAFVDAHDDAMKRRLLQHALNAWLRCCDELATIDTPLGALVRTEGRVEN